MNEEQKAQRLAEWLASPEGSDPPEDLDPEVLSAVFVLRPDRTPAPRVSLDDVLAGVKEGPFATVEPTMDNVVEFPRPARPAPEEVRPVREAKKRRSPSRMWVAPILGFGFAAAAAALLSFPMLAKLQSHRFAEPDLSTMPTPAAAPAPEPSPDAMIAPVTAAPERKPAAPLPEMEPRLNVMGEGATAESVDRPMAEAPRDTKKESQDLSTADGSIATGGEAAGMRAPPPPPASSTPAPTTTATATTATTTSSRTAPTTARAPAGEPEAAPVNGPTTLWDGRPMAKEDAPGIADMDEEEKAPAPKGSWLPADDTVATESASRDRAPKTRSKPAAAAPAANAATTIASSTPDKSAKGSPAEARRERAGAMDYSSTWYQSDPDVAAKYAPALAQEAAGNWAQAASLWQALVNDARVDVGQDAALRAGKAWRAAGRTTEALAVVDAGLRRSSANTATRSSLLVLRGEVLAELGRNSESKKALEDADQLDGDR